jgi:hypothetical protein
MGYELKTSYVGSPSSIPKYVSTMQALFFGYTWSHILRIMLWQVQVNFGNIVPTVQVFYKS